MNASRRPPTRPSRRSRHVRASRSTEPRCSSSSRARRLEAQTRQHEHQAEVLLEHFSNRLDELLAAVDRADDTAPRAEPAPPPPPPPTAPTAPTATELQTVVAEAPVTQASVTLPVRSADLPVPGARSAAPASAKTRVSAAQLHASLDALRRTAAGDWVHAELTFNALRLTVFDTSGWWEFHDVPVEGTQLDRTWTTIDMGELVAALDVERQHVENDWLELTLDGDIVIGTTLVLSRTVEGPSLTGTRRKVEQIDLGLSGHGDLVLDSQLGRLRVPSRLISLLRSRQAHDVHLVTIGERPFLRAQVVGVSEDVPATILAELADESVAPDGEGGERRDTAHSPVTDLIGALTPTTSAEELAAILTSGVEYAVPSPPRHIPPCPQICSRPRCGTTPTPCAEQPPRTRASRPRRSPTLQRTRPVRCAFAVAAHRNAGAELLDELARDDVVAVREQAAANPSLPAAADLRLTQDAYATVRAALGTNVGISDDLLGVLARDPDPRVGAAVARSARCPQDLLDTLSTRPGSGARQPTGTRAPPERCRGARHSATLRTAVAGNLSTPVRQLDALSRDEAPEVRGRGRRERRCSSPRTSPCER